MIWRFSTSPSSELSSTCQFSSIGGMPHIDPVFAQRIIPQGTVRGVNILMMIVFHGVVLQLACFCFKTDGAEVLQKGHREQLIPPVNAQPVNPIFMPVKTLVIRQVEGRVLPALPLRGSPHIQGKTVCVRKDCCRSHPLFAAKQLLSA